MKFNFHFTPADRLISVGRGDFLLASACFAERNRGMQQHFDNGVWGNFAPTSKSRRADF